MSSPVCRFMVALWAAGAVAASGCSGERSFPNQPITLICPWSAGGGTDRVSRQTAVLLERELGVPVNVVNAVGGSGVTGHTRGALARPDGYTITMLTVELNILHWRDLTALTYRDYAPLALLNCDSAALFVQQNAPYQTLDDLEAAVRDHAGKIKVSGTAYGGVWHIAWAGWLNRRGIKTDAASWISINGSGQSLQELTAGGVDVVCCSLPEADALLSANKVRCLGLMAEARLPEFADVPTFREQGHDWSLLGWRGVGAPRDTPPERLQVLAAALERVAHSDEMHTFMHNAGFNLTFAGPAEFNATLARQDQLFHDILEVDEFRSVSGEHFGLMTFPSLVGVLLALVLVVVAVEVRRERSTATAGALPATGIDRRSWALAAAVLGAVVFYLAAAEPLGFVPTAAVLVGGLLVLFRVRPPIAVFTALCVSVLTYQVFAIGLRVPLPRGPWGW